MMHASSHICVVLMYLVLDANACVRSHVLTNT